MNENSQYLRKCNLILANEAGQGIVLDEFRIVFAVKKTDGETPNTAVIRVYNLNEDTKNKIEKEFTDVTLQAGYGQMFGVIFSGTAKKVSKGAESNVDTFIEIQAADGDTAYNFSTVNATIAAGATQRDQIEQIIKVMKSKGVEAGSIELDDTQKLPRGKVMYGMSRNYMRRSSASGLASWTIQNGKVQVVPLTGVLPGEAVVLNSNTGLIGRPEQTNSGIKFRCLLNPFIMMGGAIQIKEEDIQAGQIEESNDNKKKKKDLASIEADGFYRVIAMTLKGDTRGNDWYCEGECLDIDASVPKDKSVQVN
jgi:hypothetical protein